ncbi:hypothetical protein QBC40DRAFT_298119 [Triangularia verruculosa]|uniref:Uncharacterized protein n=1 Tax=Triangularia verruculosa TaxID=2587418 RepID=A0AAN6XEL1_9PEZI|nr:hypothetical protein QBC40DRAFT_298119 [Triangularia verruculosa]
MAEGFRISSGSCGTDEASVAGKRCRERGIKDAQIGSLGGCETLDAATMERKLRQGAPLVRLLLPQASRRRLPHLRQGCVREGTGSTRSKFDPRSGSQQQAVIHNIFNELQKVTDLSLKATLSNGERNYSGKTALLAEAKDYFTEALTIYQKASSASEELLATVSSNAGRNVLHLGECEEAERLLSCALIAQQSLLGDAHYFTTATMCLSYRRMLLGDQNPRVGVAYHKRATVLRRQGTHLALENALRGVQLALQAFEASEDSCEPGLAIRARFLLAFVLQDLGYTEQSVQVLRTALQLGNSIMRVPCTEPYSVEVDIDKLVQPDFW